MWYACSIAVDSWFENPAFQLPIELAAGVRIEPVPEWVKEKPALKVLSWLDRKNIKSAKLTFAIEYDAEALGSPDPDWSDQNPRSIQSVIDEKFVLASVALWLAKPCRLTCGPVLHFGRQGDPESLRRSGSLSTVLIRDDENENTPSSADFDQAGAFLEVILSLQRDTAIWLAIRMLVRALTESMWEARYLWQWVVLKALFGPDSGGETTYRLAQRIALFLGETPDNRKNLFETAKKAYSWRSKIVHGSRLSKLTPSKSKELTVFTEKVLRDALQKILGSPELVQQFGNKKRDEYLDGLTFG